MSYIDYKTTNSVNPQDIIINKTNGYIGEINPSKYVTLVFTDGSKDTLKKYEELWSIIRDLIRFS